MQAHTKIALVAASILSMGALTACQSTSSSKPEYAGHMMGHHHDRQMSPEQRAHFKQMRAERQAFHEQVQKACDGKTIGQTTQLKAGDKTVDGTCNMVFKADRKALREMRSEFRQDQGRMMRDHHRGQHHMQQMTEEQRAQLQQQREQKRTERQAFHEQVQKACAGQNNGQPIQVKLGEKTITGTCVVKFQAQKSVQPMQSIPPITDIKAS